MKCRCCRSENLQPASDSFNSFQRHVRLLKCLRCGSMSLDDISGLDVKRFYEEEYFTGDSGSYFYNRRYKYIRSNPEILSYLKKHLIQSAKAMDIGCGPEKVLSGLINEKFPDVTVVNADFVKFKDLQEKLFLNLDFDCPDIVEKLLPYQKSFDFLTAVDFLEHLKNPEHVFIAADTLLKNGGRLILKYPDIESALHRVNLFLLRLGVGGTFRILGLPHLCYPSWQFMLKMLRRYSMQIEINRNLPTYFGVFDEAISHPLKSTAIYLGYRIFYLYSRLAGTGNKKTLVLRKMN